MISQFDNLVWNVVDSVLPPLNYDRNQWFGLINAIIQKESTFNPNAVSYTGEGIGLMQVNPKIWLNQFNVTREKLFDPLTNIQIGAQILRDYISQFGTSGGLGAYFAGPAARLTNAAKSYANTVLSYYNNLIAKVRGLFSTDQYYFTDPVKQATDFFYNELPEQGGGGTSIDWTIPVIGLAALFIILELID
jgi:hypothetical protein